MTIAKGYKFSPGVNRPHRGQSSTPLNPGNSKLMHWVHDNLDHQGDDCLFSPFVSTRQGYVGTTRGGKWVYIHRWICEIVNGPAPSSKHQASHSCGRGHEGCLNRKHLSWKTPRDNQLDRRAHGTAGRGRGVKKLTPQQVSAIHKSSDPPGVVAALVGCSEANVRQIKSGKTWRREHARLAPTQTA